MLHHIENELLACTIDSLGAEIRSLKHKASGQEYIWPMNPKVWGSSSPVLFPAIGSIKGGEISFKGESFPLSKHGIIRNNAELSFSAEGTNQCSFSLQSNEKSRKLYPFEFEFKVSYSLDALRLRMTFEVMNKGDKPMPFLVGGHTAYYLPLRAGLALSDYQIEIPGNKRFIEAATLSETGLLGKRIRNFPLQDGALALSESIFKEDALIFKDVDFDELSLRTKDGGERLRVYFKGFPHLALWAKPGADYVCIEPWLGLPDRDEESMAIMEKSTYNKLEPKSTFSISIETEIIAP